MSAGLGPDPTGELTVLPRPLAGFKGAASRQEGNGGEGREGLGEGNSSNCSEIDTSPTYVKAWVAQLDRRLQRSVLVAPGLSPFLHCAWLGDACKNIARCRVTCVGWRVTLCDPIWQVTLRSSVMGLPLRAILGFNLLKRCAEDGTRLYRKCWTIWTRVNISMPSTGCRYTAGRWKSGTT